VAATAEDEHLGALTRRQQHLPCVTLGDHRLQARRSVVAEGVLDRLLEMLPGLLSRLPVTEIKCPSVGGWVVPRDHRLDRGSCGSPDPLGPPEGGLGRFGTVHTDNDSSCTWKLLRHRNHLPTTVELRHEHSPGSEGPSGHVDWGPAASTTYRTARVLRGPRGINGSDQRQVCHGLARLEVRGPSHILATTSAVCNGYRVARSKVQTGAKHDPRDAASDEEDTEAFVTALLTASRVLVGVSARSLSEIESAVTVTQFRTLVVLDRQGETNLSGLAASLGVNASTALRMIDRLLVAELVTRRDNPETRREVLLGLTPAGRRLVRRVTRRRRAELTRVVAAMPSGRRSELLAALRAFAEAAGEPEPSPDEVSALAWYVDSGPESGSRKRAASGRSASDDG
jgi:DNA-binding MarR family transcriptional regulator